MEDAAFYRMGGGFVISLILWLLANVVLGFFTSWLADRKGYNGVRWFALTVFFSFMAFLTMVGAPSKDEAVKARLRSLSIPTDER